MAFSNCIKAEGCVIRWHDNRSIDNATNTYLFKLTYTWPIIGLVIQLTSLLPGSRSIEYALLAFARSSFYNSSSRAEFAYAVLASPTCYGIITWA